MLQAAGIHELFRKNKQRGRKVDLSMFNEKLIGREKEGCRRRRRTQLEKLLGLIRRNKGKLCQMMEIT